MMNEFTSLKLSLHKVNFLRSMSTPPYFMSFLQRQTTFVTSCLYFLDHKGFHNRGYSLGDFFFLLPYCTQKRQNSKEF